MVCVRMWVSFGVYFVWLVPQVVSILHRKRFRSTVTEGLATAEELAILCAAQDRCSQIFWNLRYAGCSQCQTTFAVAVVPAAAVVAAAVAGDEKLRASVFADALVAVAAAGGGPGGAAHGSRLWPAGTGRVRPDPSRGWKPRGGSIAGGARVPVAGSRRIGCVAAADGVGPIPIDRIVWREISRADRRPRGLLRRPPAPLSRIPIRSRRDQWRC